MWTVVHSFIWRLCYIDNICRFDYLTTTRSFEELNQSNISSRSVFVAKCLDVDVLLIIIVVVVVFRPNITFTQMAVRTLCKNVSNYPIIINNNI